jgi:hypothetical protein
VAPLARFGAAALLVAVLAPPAAAQERRPADPDDEAVREPPPPPLYVAALREPGRAVIGLDFGLGMFDAVCSGCYAEGGISLSGFGGAQLTRRVALLADVWALMHLIAQDMNETGAAAHAMATAGARVWIIPRLWVQAGIGAGCLAVTGTGPDDGVDGGPSALLAIGGELGHKRTSGIDLSVRIGATRLAGDRGSTDADDPDDGDAVLLYSIAAVVGYHWN